MIALLAPHCCSGCGVEGAVVCRACATALPTAGEICYRCLEVSLEGVACQKCLPTLPFGAVQAATDYFGLSRQLVRILKFHHAAAAARPMARLMAPLLAGYPDAYLLPVPTATTRVRQRGYDQAKLLTKELAALSGLPRLDCLARLSQAHQVGAARQQRLLQMRGAFRIKNTRLIPGAHIILIDDVLTTGATLEAAARTLLQSGAARVDALVFARA